MKEEIIKQFKNNMHTFDKGGLEERYAAAKIFNETYCKGTPYYAKVDEYCAHCTVTILKEHDKGDVQWEY